MQTNILEMSINYFLYNNNFYVYQITSVIQPRNICNALINENVLYIECDNSFHQKAFFSVNDRSIYIALSTFRLPSIEVPFNYAADK